MISFDLICDVSCDFCGKKQGARVEVQKPELTNPRADYDVGPYNELIRKTRAKLVHLTTREEWSVIQIGSKFKLSCKECGIAKGLVEVPNIKCSRCGVYGHAAGSWTTVETSPSLHSVPPWWSVTCKFLEGDLMTTKMEPMPLQAWFNANQPAETMLWKDALAGQVMLVRDRIAALVSETYEEYRDKVSVVSTHCSKSIVCPVYHFESQGTKFWLRYNFYNWNVSVDATGPVTEAAPWGKDRAFGDWVEAFDKSYGNCFVEGMKEWKFEPWSKDHGKFTVCIEDHYDLYVFFWLWRRERKITRKD